MKMYGEWKYSSAILDLGTGWSWEVSFMPWVYPHGKGPQHPLSSRLVGPESQSGHCGVENISCPYWESKACCPARSEVLYLLSYPGSFVCTNWHSPSNLMINTIRNCIYLHIKQSVYKKLVRLWWITISLLSEHVCFSKKIREPTKLMVYRSGRDPFE
jgi:hypothetical protein